MFRNWLIATALLVSGCVYCDDEQGYELECASKDSVVDGEEATECHNTCSYSCITDRALCNTLFVAGDCWIDSEEVCTIGPPPECAKTCTGRCGYYNSAQDCVPTAIF